MFSSLWNKIKEIVMGMIGSKTIERALHITPAISTKMSEAMTLWGQMYRDEAPWLHDPTVENPIGIYSLGLPALIASEKARMATLEFKSIISVTKESVDKPNPNYSLPTKDMLGNPIVSNERHRLVDEVDTSDSERADFLNEAYQREIIKQIRPQLEYGIAKGGLIIKPYIVLAAKTDENGNIVKGEKIPKIQVEYIQADSFYPISFDSSGKITEAVFVQTKQDKNNVYRRLEYHHLIGTKVTVKNKAYKATNASDNGSSVAELDLGQEVPLSSIPEWADLKPETSISNVDRLLFGYFKMPEANNIDQFSPLGISGFARAVKLIEQADKQYSRLLWEFEATEAAIDIDRDALTEVSGRDGTHRSVNPIMQQRLFRPVDLGESDTYKVYNPQIRDGNIVNGLNQILMRIEDVCAISRGTLSEVTNEARTATELKILKQRSYAANVDIQQALEKALRDVAYIMNVYCDLYEVTPSGDWDVSFEWDDSILVDVDAELSKRLTLLNNGITSRIETRMWYFGESEAQARKALDLITEENQEDAERNMVIQNIMSGTPNAQEEDEEGEVESPSPNKEENPQPTNEEDEEE